MRAKSQQLDEIIERISRLLDQPVDHLSEDECKRFHEELNSVLLIRPQDGNALRLLGDLHQRGIGVNQDHTKAIAYYEQAMKAGNVKAITRRAKMHYTGRGGLVDKIEAVKLFTKAAELDDSEAMVFLAETLEKNKQYAAAIELYKKASNLHNPDAMFKLAKLYENKHGPADIEQRLRFCAQYYRKAFQASHNHKREEVLVHFKVFSAKHERNWDVTYNYLLTQLDLGQSFKLNPMYFEQMLYSLVNDFALPLDKKLNYLTQIWSDPYIMTFVNQKKILGSLSHAAPILLFGDFQLHIAKRALAASANLSGQHARLQRKKAEQAFELAELARVKLLNISDESSTFMIDIEGFHERITLLLCEARLTTVQTDVESFVSTVTDLRQFPERRHSSSMLMNLVKIANLEPYISSKERQQLILILASRADRIGTDPFVQKLATQAISELQKANQIAINPTDLCLVTSDFLYLIAKEALLKAKKNNSHPELRATLRDLIDEEKSYDPKHDAALLNHPLVKENLTNHFRKEGHAEMQHVATFESILYQSFSPKQRLVPLESVQNAILRRLDELSYFYTVYPKKFTPSITLTDDAEKPTESGSREEFLAFLTQRRIQKAIANALKHHIPSSTFITAFSFMSESAHQSKINNAIAAQLTQLQQQCEPPQADFADCAKGLIDFLSNCQLDTLPINPIMSHLLEQLLFLTVDKENLANASPTVIRDHVCSALNAKIINVEPTIQGRQGKGQV